MHLRMGQVRALSPSFIQHASSPSLSSLSLPRLLHSTPVAPSLLPPSPLSLLSTPPPSSCPPPRGAEEGCFIDNPLVRMHHTIVMIRWTGLAPWEFEFTFPDRLASTFRVLLLSP